MGIEGPLARRERGPEVTRAGRGWLKAGRRRTDRAVDGCERTANGQRSVAAQAGSDTAAGMRAAWRRDGRRGHDGYHDVLTMAGHVDGPAATSIGIM